jgi:sugar-specific transcriptional regulator TrmB
VGGNRKNYKGNLFLGYMEEKSLEKIGLTKNETKVYLALLKIGTSKVGEILKESKLNSGKIYEVINSLEQKGLVSESTINNVKHFTATSKVLIAFIGKSFREKTK